jgi:hypothetical protein
MRFELNCSRRWLAKRLPRRNRRSFFPIVAAAVKPNARNIWTFVGLPLAGKPRGLASRLPEFVTYYVTNSDLANLPGPDPRSGPTV